MKQLSNQYLSRREV